MIDQISACSWLFLDSLADGPSNTLRLILNEGRTQDEVEDVVIAGTTISGTRAVKHDDSCRVFEVLWDTYICYTIRNESYTPGDGIDWKGQRVRPHAESAFLAYVAAETFASASYPGPFTHLEFVCENHIIDVASTDEPTVRLLKAGRPRGV